MEQSRILVLAREIQDNTAKLDEYYEANNAARLSFDQGAEIAPRLPKELAACQEALTAALDELHWLNQTPLQIVMGKVIAPSVGFRGALRFGIPSLVPLGSGTTFSDLAEKTGVSEKKLARLLRHAMTDHFFCEPEPGTIKHTAASKALVQVPGLMRWASMALNEVGPAKIKATVEKWPQSEEPNHSGFNLANETTMGMFEFFEHHPDRMNWFKDAMNFLGSAPGFESSWVIQGFDWASLGDGLVVDVGGSHGMVSLTLAKAFPLLRFVVQDLPKVVEGAAEKTPAELADRVSSMAHDMFAEQPVKQAGVYYFRWIFHDWSDKYCIKMLRSLVPALKPGSRIVISDQCLAPPCTLSGLKERAQRESDIVMFAMQNSRERDRNDWQSLFESADPRLQLEEIKKIPGSRLDTIVARWN